MKTFKIVAKVSMFAEDLKFNIEAEDAIHAEIITRSLLNHDSEILSIEELNTDSLNSTKKDDKNEH